MAYLALQQRSFNSRTFHRSVPNTVKIKCDFNHAGCQCTFYNWRSCKIHQDTCFYGLFTSCRNPECTADYMFSSPKQLVKHAHAEHGVETRTSHDFQTLKITLDKRFLFPGEKGYYAKILRSYKFTMEGMDATIPVHLVVKEDKLGDDAKVMIVPIQSIDDWEKFQNHNNLVELKCHITGRNGKVIESLSTPADQTKVSITVSKSHRQFFGSTSRYKCALYSRQDIIRHGVTDTLTGTTTIEITTVLKTFRCVKKGSHGYCSQPHATTWNDFNIPKEIKKTMLDDSEKEPWFSTRTLLPVFLEEKNLIIESSFESYAMNSIMAGTLCNMDPHLDQNDSAQTQVLILMPNTTSVDLHIKEWKMRASKCGFTVCRLIDYSDKPISNLMFYGAQIIVTTPAVLASFIENHRTDKDKNQLVNVMASHLSHVHLHRPSNFQEYFYSGLFKDIMQMSKVTAIRKTVSDNLVSSELQQLLQFYFFQGPAEFVSVGPNPKKLIRNNTFVRRCINEGKENHVVKIIKDDLLGPRKWLIVVSSTNEFLLYPLLDVLRLHFQPRQLTIVTSLQQAQNNPYLLESFTGRKDAIVIAPCEALELEELRMAKGIIVYDDPEEEAELVRIALRKSLPQEAEPKMLIFTFAKE